MTSITAPAPVWEAPPFERLTLPMGWTRRSDADHHVLLYARPRRAAASGHDPHLTLRVCDVEHRDLASWRCDELTLARERLDGFDLEDDDSFWLEGTPTAYHRFGYLEAGHDLLVEQWAWLIDGVGLTLTCELARSEYLELCDEFEDVALDAVRLIEEG